MVRRLFIVGLILLFGLSSVIGAFANESAVSLTEEAIMAPEFGINVLTEEQIEFLQQNPDLMEKRVAKDMDYLRKNTEQAIIDAVINDSKNGDVSVVTVGTPVEKGQRYVFTVADMGNMGGSTSGAGVKAHNYQTGSSAWADVKVQSVGWGSASAWAYVGRKIIAQGDFSGQKIPAVITYSGRATGEVIGTNYGTAEGRIKVVVLDLSANAIAAEGFIWTGSSSNMQKRTYDSTYKRSLSLNLISGREYIVYHSVGTDATTSHYQGAPLGDFYNNARGGRGLDWTNVEVDLR